MPIYEKYWVVMYAKSKTLWVGFFDVLCKTVEAEHFTCYLVDNVYAPPPALKQDPYDELFDHFITVTDQIDSPHLNFNTDSESVEFVAKIAYFW